MTVSKGVDHTLTDLGGSRPTAQDLLKAGDRISHYVISRELGRGGMGAVYLAQNETIDVPVAIKILPPALAYANPDAAIRFLREARLAANLVHPNVIKMIDCGKDPTTNIHYLVQEFVEGGSVKDRLENGPIPEKDALEWLVQIAGALQAASSKKIIHRDIKPDNILLTADGEAKLADLGLAKDITSSTAHLTQSNVGIGTPAYMSPEQISDAKNVDTRSDIYSLGATFFHMLTGRAPYMGASVINILNKVINEAVPDPMAINPKLNPFLARVCMKMIQKDPEQRYQTPEELLRALASDEAPAEFTTTSLESVGAAPQGNNGGEEGVAPAPSQGSELDQSALVAIGALVILALILVTLFSVLGGKDETEDNAKVAAKELNPTIKSDEKSAVDSTEKKDPIQVAPIPDPAPVIEKKSPTPAPIKKDPEPDGNGGKTLDARFLTGLRMAIGFNKRSQNNGVDRVHANAYSDAEASSFVAQAESMISESGRKTVFRCPSSTERLPFDFKTKTMAFWAKPGNLRTAVIVDSGGNIGALQGLNLGVFGGFTYNKWDSLKPGFFLGLWNHDFLLPMAEEQFINQWHFVAVTFDDTSIRVMIDGQFPTGHYASPQSNTPISMTQPFRRPQRFRPRTSEGLRIGEAHSYSSPEMRPYMGFVDDVAIWDRPLSNAELKLLYDFSKTGGSYCEALEKLKR